MELYEYQEHVVTKAINYFEDTIDPKPFNIFFKMGLGKTIMAIEISKRLKPKTILIVCPKSLKSMWEYNLSKHYRDYVLYSKPDYWNFTNYTQIAIMNYEAFLNWKSEIRPELLILDEVHKIKNANSKTHKQIKKYVKATKTITLTGTPITRNLMDLYGILTCQNTQSITPTQFKLCYIVNGGNTSKLKLIESIKPYTCMGDLEEYIELPGYEDIIIPVTLSHSELEEHKRICYSEDNALTRLTKCQQLTSGIKFNSSKKTVCNLLIKELLEDDEKIVLFTRYDEEFDYFMKEYSQICVGINGKTKDRETPVYEFQNNPNIKLFVGNIQTAGMGITLTSASKCIIYSETFAWGDADQARARIYRIGQTNFCTYYHLLATNTVDEMIFENNINKTNLIQEFKDKFGGN